ncbi:MAG: hypothetical protein P1V81_01450 [Planctomycetota bacterium]|nr:hypothetical protein [Planctomycetota bacterium]
MPISTSTRLPVAALLVGLLTVAAPLWTASLGQDPVVEDPEGGEDPGTTPVLGDDFDPDLEVAIGRDRPEEAWELAEEWQGLIGTWQLMQFEHVERWIDSNDVRGYVNLGEGVMTMIIHARNDESNEMPAQLAQAGIHRWRMVRGNILQTATMMGHSNMGEELEWEIPNTPREFRVELDGSNLSLHRPDASRLILRRVDSFAFPDEAKQAIRNAQAYPAEED